MDKKISQFDTTYILLNGAYIPVVQGNPLLDDYKVDWEEITNQNPAFISLSNDVLNKLEDAPIDGEQYARENGAWTVVADAGPTLDIITETPTGGLNGVNTSFTLSDTPIGIDFCWVTINGISRTPLSLVGKVITLDFAPQADVIEFKVKYFISLSGSVPSGGGDINVIEEINVNGVALVPDVNKSVDILCAAPLGLDDNYVTDAEKADLHSHSNKTDLDNVSGTNTGDETKSTIESKLTGVITSHEHGSQTADSASSGTITIAPNTTKVLTTTLTNVHTLTIQAAAPTDVLASRFVQFSFTIGASLPTLTLNTSVGAFTYGKAAPTLAINSTYTYVGWWVTTTKLLVMWIKEV